MTLLRSPIRSSIRLPAYNPLAGKWGNADPLGAWLLNATYADYDARKLDRMFQESTGQTPVIASADKVGLWLDGSQFGTKTLTQVLAANPNDEFNYANTAALQSIWSITSGGVVGTLDAGRMLVTGASGSISRTFALPAGSYGVMIELEGGTNSVDCVIGSASGGSDVVPAFNGGIAAIGSGKVKRFAQFKWAGGTVYVRVRTGATVGGTCWADNLYFVPGNHASQGTSTQRLNLLISGSRYSLTADGTDDNLLSTYLAGAGANSIIIDTDVPASLAATQVIAGMSGSATARLSIGINTSGQLCAGVGSDANTTIVGSTDWRGTRLIAALSADGSTVKLLSATGEEYSAAQNGSPTTTIPARLAANNNNGTASSFYGGGIARAIIAQKALDLATFNAIRAQLLAS